MWPDDRLTWKGSINDISDDALREFKNIWTKNICSRTTGTAYCHSEALQYKNVFVVSDNHMTTLVWLIRGQNEERWENVTVRTEWKDTISFIFIIQTPLRGLQYAFCFWFNQYNQSQALCILEPLWIKNQTKIPPAKSQIMKTYVQKPTRYKLVPWQ
jgi:hypothetical protein